MKRTLILGVILLVAVGAGAYYLGYRNDQNNSQPRQQQTGQQAEQNQADNTKGTCLADECLKDSSITYPVSELPQNIQTVLASAIADEYAARDTYQAVVDKYGNERPFVMIVRSEEQHVNAIKSLYDKYGLKIPESSTQVSIPGSFTEACAQGVSIEKADITLYDDKVLPAVQSYPDMVNVFTSLREASRNHLAAFEKCA